MGLRELIFGDGKNSGQTEIPKDASVDIKDLIKDIRRQFHLIQGQERMAFEAHHNSLKNHGSANAERSRGIFLEKFNELNKNLKKLKEGEMDNLKKLIEIMKNDVNLHDSKEYKDANVLVGEFEKFEASVKNSHMEEHTR